MAGRETRVGNTEMAKRDRLLRGIHMSIQEALLIIEMADHDEVTAIDFIEALETVGGEA